MEGGRNRAHLDFDYLGSGELMLKKNQLWKHRIERDETWVFADIIIESPVYIWLQ